MAVYLLDTDVIVDWLHGKRSALLLRELLDKGHRLACCAINLVEVYSGALPGELEKTDRLLNELEHVAITPEIARRAGLLRRDYARKGITLSLADATIAAVALTEKLFLFTHNRRHFPMPELRLYPQRVT